METGQTNSSSGTLGGTLGGTLLIVMVNITSAELVKTVLLAVIGALVSFLATLCLQGIVRAVKRRRYRKGH